MTTSSPPILYYVAYGARADQALEPTSRFPLQTIVDPLVGTAGLDRLMKDLITAGSSYGSTVTLAAYELSEGGLQQDNGSSDGGGLILQVPGQTLYMASSQEAKLYSWARPARCLGWTELDGNVLRGWTVYLSSNHGLDGKHLSQVLTELFAEQARGPSLGAALFLERMLPSWQGMDGKQRGSVFDLKSGAGLRYAVRADLLETPVEIRWYSLGDGSGMEAAKTIMDLLSMLWETTRHQPWIFPVCLEAPIFRFASNQVPIGRVLESKLSPVVGWRMVQWATTTTSK